MPNYIVSTAILLSILLLLGAKSSQPKGSIHIIAPRLDLNDNKISAASATMPNLIFKLELHDITVPKQVLYKWWVRVRYRAGPLRISPKLSTIGCQTSGRHGESAVWTLPGGNQQQACIKDMSKRDTWILTTKPVLDLNRSVIIQDKSGKLSIVALKDKSGKPLTHKGSLVYGGGQLEIVAKLEFESAESIKKKYIARFPHPKRHKASANKLRGLNPDQAELLAEIKKIKQALSATVPTSQQQKLREKITGKKNAPTIPKALQTVFIPLIDEIACRETLHTHFCRIGFCLGIENTKGFPIVAQDGGYGMFQLTNPHPSYQAKWSWVESLMDTVKQLYPHIRYATKIASKFQTQAEREKVYFRELTSRHNLSAVSYFKKEGHRRPIICREQIAFEKNAPNTSPIYRKSLERNHALLQALEIFGNTLIDEDKRECNKGMGRDISYIKKRSKIKIYSVSLCRDGEHKIAKEGKPFKTMATIPKFLAVPLHHLGAALIDNKKASCNISGENKNAARRIIAKFTPPNNYIIEEVGRCHNSPTCYVDVDMLSLSGKRNACIGPETRRRF